MIGKKSTEMNYIYYLYRHLYRIAQEVTNYNNIENIDIFYSGLDMGKGVQSTNPLDQKKVTIKKVYVFLYKLIMSKAKFPKVK